MHNEDYYVRAGTAFAVDSAFPYIPHKEQAWEDITFLVHDEERHVRRSVSFVIGSAFQYSPDKSQAWNHLMHLKQDKDSSVRASANHSLGSVSIFEATEAKTEDNFKKELEKALEFFEESLKEDTYSNPASFCLPFYRSFYAITFKKQEADVQKYLDEAKIVMEGSDSKEKLIEAIENLAEALKEIQKARSMDFNSMKCNLNSYRRYCERAAYLLDATENKAPRATKLIRKGLPIIDQKIKSIIAEIQEKSNSLCKQTQGTPLEDLGKEVYHQGQALLKIGDPIKLEKSVNNFLFALSAICAKMPVEDKGEACKLIEMATKERYVEDMLNSINMVLPKISSQLSIQREIEKLDEKLDEIQISLKPGIREELVITVGAEFAGTGARHEIHIPLQEISYYDLKKDLEKIKGKTIQKLSSLPVKLAEKVKDYLIRNQKDEILKHLT